MPYKERTAKQKKQKPFITTSMTEEEVYDHVALIPEIKKALELNTVETMKINKLLTGDHEKNPPVLGLVDLANINRNKISKLSKVLIVVGTATVILVVLHADTMPIISSIGKAVIAFIH